ncbi:hypothetical protein FEM03_01235 [Phragmitibacter flavus]|uniref:Ferritin-like domain-containing protein n=1 Tax=Phragmitibacter flavus TaxID=2576071 RepID=A0A5R8KK83_9BACT|nr:hypothetical protein [Phragmitibacter flavus]TLD72726.1 hypothetical protein FEM03_01235 [Phragmitibacter flavus]
MNTNRNLAWRLNWYRQSELEGSLLLGRMVGLVEDQHVAHCLTTHAAEEAEHSRLWAEVIKELELPHIRILRSYQSFYLNHSGPPKSLLEVLCFTQIFERRVHARFTSESADPNLPEPAHRAYERMIEDEKDHLGWVAHWLRGQPDAVRLMQNYQKIDHEVFNQLLPYEQHLYDIPGLGKESDIAACQLHAAHD